MFNYIISCIILHDQMIAWHIILWFCIDSPDTDMLIIWHWYVILNTWSLTLESWHRHLTCYTGHLISDTWYLTPVLDMLYLIPDPWYLISDTGTWHVITWHLIPDTWYMTLGNWHVITYLICFHMVLAHLTWYCDTWLGYYYTCIILHIHDYHFYGDLHDYYIVTRHFVLLNSCAPELLYTWTPWKRETPDTIYSCWSP